MAFRSRRPPFSKTTFISKECENGHFAADVSRFWAPKVALKMVRIDIFFQRLPQRLPRGLPEAPKGSQEASEMVPRGVLVGPHATDPWHVAGPGGMRVALTIIAVVAVAQAFVFILAQLFIVALEHYS